MIRQLCGKSHTPVRSLGGFRFPSPRRCAVALKHSPVGSPSFPCRSYRSPLPPFPLGAFTGPGGLPFRALPALAFVPRTTPVSGVAKRFKSGPPNTKDDKEEGGVPHREGPADGTATPPSQRNPTEGCDNADQRHTDGSPHGAPSHSGFDGGAGHPYGEDDYETYAPSLRVAQTPSAVELPESTFLKCLAKEMDDERLRLEKDEGPPPAPTGWELCHVAGTSFIYGRRRWEPLRGVDEPTASAWRRADEDRPTTVPTTPRTRRQRHAERHFVRVQLTTRDPSLDPECDIRGEHVPFSFFVQRIPFDEEKEEGDYNSRNGDHQRDLVLSTDKSSPASSAYSSTFNEEDELSIYRNSIEVRLDVIEGELVVDNLVFHGAYSVKGKEKGGDHDNSDPDQEKDLRVMYNNPFGGYSGPNLDEAEDEVLDGIQAWLAERHIDDQFGEFIGQYSVWIEQMEYERWLQQFYDYVAA
ncbi:unnamed protein product [Phytomonas sp. Hart1]|nr:unnamed protein product [Phytomonas sp. Hart1]|eukprot:CCW69084.1 unnamed protein product [Phytomonas sp. isolate Hart1]